MKELSDFIDEIVSSHTDDDGNLDKFGVLALAFIGISLGQVICEQLLSRKQYSNLRSISTEEILGGDID